MHPESSEHFESLKQGVLELENKIEQNMAEKRER